MKGMKKIKSPDHGYWLPAVIISCAVRWYMRFNLSLCNIEGNGASVPATSASDWLCHGKGLEASEIDMRSTGYVTRV